MTQFVLADIDESAPLDLRVVSVAPRDEQERAFARAVMDGRGRFVVSAETRQADSLLDELHDVLHLVGGDPRGTAIVSVLSSLAERRIRIALWYGADCENLHVIETASSFLRELQHQAAREPPEVWLRFEPR